MTLPGTFGQTGRVAAILVALSMFPIYFVGCVREESAGLATAPTQEEINEARYQLELADFHAQAKLPFDLEKEREETQKIVEESLRRIENLQDEDEKDRRYAETVRHLIVESRFDEAELVCGKIHHAETKDLLLEDIVRFRMRETLETFRSLPGASVGETFDEQIRSLVRQAGKTSRQIVDPLRRAETYGNIALFCLNMKDREIAVEMMRYAEESIGDLLDGSIQKARGFCFLARWFLKQEEREEASRCCDKSEAAALHVGNPAEAATVLLEISSIRTLLGNDAGASNANGRAGEFVPLIKDDREKATVLLRLADTLLIGRMKEKEESRADSLRQIKTLALEAADRIESLPEGNTESLANELREPENDPLFGTGMFEVASNPIALPSKELFRLKNELLGKIAMMQAWGSSLEEVWETILDIDEGPQRDEALIAAIDMMIVSGATEDAEAWADEISDKKEKQRMFEKIKVPDITDRNTP